MKFQFTDEQRQEMIKWRDELRTTAKAQGEGQLRSLDNDFCCLGIYVDMYPDKWTSDEDTWFVKERIPDNEKIGSEFDDLYFDLELPHKMSEVLGLDKTTKLLDPNGEMSNLQAIFIYMNDEAHLTFKEIANEIDHLLEHGTFSRIFQYNGADADQIEAAFAEE
jgi:hypothetical protein